MVNDSHLHVGQFYDMCTSPRQLIELADSVGIGRFAVSSTTTCEENYHKVLREIKEICVYAGSRACAVLWLTPLLLAKDMLPLYLDSGVDWRCLKIHPQAHSYWTEEPGNMDDVTDIARGLNVPLLIHTGEFLSCEPHCFEDIIKCNQDIRFILAHSRPVVQTINLLGRYENAYCDTAFTPICDVEKLVDCGFADRVLWGSDVPIQRHFDLGVDLSDYYLDRLTELKSKISPDAFSKITESNFDNLFL